MAPLTGYSGPFEYFADLFLKEEVSLHLSIESFQLSVETYWGSWTEHVLGWWKHKDDANVLFLTYEDLKENLPSQIRLIAKFVGKSLTEETMERIAKQCTFNEMKKNASAYWMMTRDGELPNYLRRGQIGGWKDYFTPELTARFESEVLSKLEGTGLQFGSGQ
ncbi:Sulfotransferase domain [Desmophyllum pertusum]|uniref:Sulfotransferase domain n=1 Tax=Desmophyllum pertusum TaxID=174260 RepID=A0A9X0DAJ5_9CNID|nr:Sulfotransferase domain [Desmophyllum pertusum]